MSRYIDADALIESVNGVSTHWLNDWSTLGVLSMIDKQPTVDAVQVVRCRECKKKFARDEDYKGNILGYICPHGAHEPDFYCADGERKDDETN